MLEVFKQPKYMPELGLKKIMYLAKQRLIVIHMAVYCLCQPQVFRRMKFIFMHSHFFKNSAAAAAAAAALPRIAVFISFFPKKQFIYF